MKETRAGKYGRLGSIVLKYIVDTLPVSERDDYLSRFCREFEEYSDMPREVGTPKNEGCVMELDGLDDLAVSNPEQLARWFKEGAHLKYQKRTSRNERVSFLEGL